MPVLISLSPIPNQSFTIRLEDHEYNIRLHVAKTIMAVDIIRDGEPLQLGIRAEAQTFLLPYHYQTIGNFIIATFNGDYPEYTKFGNTQFLFYFTSTELSELNEQT